MRLPSPWVPERVEKLKQLRAEGLSFTKIAIQFDWMFTRCALIGKANRLGLICSKPNKYASVPKSRKRKELKPVPTISAVDAWGFPISPGGVPLLDLKYGQCRWPLNGEGHQARFCAEAVERSYSYCSYHYELSTRKTPDINERQFMHRRYRAKSINAEAA